MELSPIAASQAWLQCLAAAAGTTGLPVHISAGDGEISAPCVLIHAVPDGQKELSPGCGIYRAAADIEIIFAAGDTPQETAAANANAVTVAISACGSADYAAVGLCLTTQWLESPDFTVHKGHRHYKQSIGAVYCQA